MLDDNDRVAQVAKLLQDLDEPFRVATMEADAGFVEDIKTPHQAASQRGGEVDALAFTSRKTVRRAIQREIAQADVQQILQPITDFRKDSLGNLLFVLAQLEIFYPRQQLADRDVDEFGDAFAAHFHVVRFGSEPCSVALRTGRLATIPCQHHTILYLVLPLAQVFEEGIDGEQSPFPLFG